VKNKSVEIFFIILILKDLPDDELTQIWYHRNMSHPDSERLLLSNAGYEVGTFLVRKSLNKNCYCVSYLYVNIQLKEYKKKTKIFISF
jgi:hypothetical protein